MRYTIFAAVIVMWIVRLIAGGDDRTQYLPPLSAGEKVQLELELQRIVASRPRPASAPTTARSDESSDDERRTTRVVAASATVAKLQ